MHIFLCSCVQLSAALTSPPFPPAPLPPPPLAPHPSRAPPSNFPYTSLPPLPFAHPRSPIAPFPFPLDPLPACVWRHVVNFYLIGDRGKTGRKPGVNTKKKRGDRAGSGWGEGGGGVGVGSGFPPAPLWVTCLYRFFLLVLKYLTFFKNFFSLCSISI